jgi:hypothetical protein
MNPNKKIRKHFLEKEIVLGQSCRNGKSAAMSKEKGID